jgi:glutamate synthase domain-containing protein 1
MENTYSPPKAQGLYDPKNEHENCGIGLIVDMKGRKSHDIVKGALEICVNLDHRGGYYCKEFAFCGRPLKEPLGRTVGGEMGVF